MKRAGHVRLFELETQQPPARIRDPRPGPQRRHRRDQQPRRECRTHDDPPGGRTTDIRPHDRRSSRSAWSIPNVSRFSHTIGLAAALWALAGGPSPTARSAPPQEPPAEPAGSMKPYVETIPGTDVKFEMLPIPGGTFDDGQPAERGEARRGRRARSTPSRSRPFWMGKCEVTWEEYDQFAFSLDLKKKAREKVDLDQAARDREEGRRRDPPDPALRRRDLRLRPQRPAGRSASPTTPRWNTADGSRPRPARSTGCPPRPSGNTPAAPGPRPPIPGATTPRSSASTPGTSTTPRSPRRSARRSPIPGASTTCTATSPSGAWTTTCPTPTSSSPTDKPTVGPGHPARRQGVFLRRPRRVVGRRRRQAPQRRAARRRTPSGASRTPSGPRASGGTPTPRSSGSGSSGRSSEQENLKGLKSQVVKGKGTR